MHKVEKMLIAIALLLLVVIVSLTAIILNTPTPTRKKNSPSPSATTTATPQPTQPLKSPSPTASTQSQKPATQQTYTSQYLTFKYPSNWSPTTRPLQPGNSKENIELGIPTLTADQQISFTSLSYDQLKPTDSIEEKDLAIDNQQGKKWIRHGEGYFSYDYYTKDPKSDASLIMHVTTSERDSEIESQLDTLIKSLKFL